MAQMTNRRSFVKINNWAIFIGLLLIVANVYWLAYVEMIWHTTYLTTVAMPVNVMFAILTMTWLNMGLRSIFPNSALKQ